jgi:hypothetical protein
MAESFFVEIIENASMLLAMALIYNTFFLREKENSIPYKLFLGLCVGFTGILLMLNAVPLSNGVFFDTRSILISITAAFLGPLPAVVGAGVVILFRLLVGGAGALTGVLVTIASTGLGLLWRYYRLEKLMHNPKRMAWLDLYLFGLLFTSRCCSAC